MKVLPKLQRDAKALEKSVRAAPQATMGM